VQELQDWLLAPFHPCCGRNRLVGCIGSAQQFFSSALSSKRLVFAPAKPGSAETVGSHVSLEPGCRSTFACREPGSVAGTGNQTSDSCTPLSLVERRAGNQSRPQPTGRGGAFQEEFQAVCVAGGRVSSTGGLAPSTWARGLRMTSSVLFFRCVLTPFPPSSSLEIRNPSSWILPPCIWSIWSNLSMLVGPHIIGTCVNRTKAS
jgi:hypothetical protein